MTGNSAGGTAAYDYIIVGGGTAGAVLASRLSEDPEATILLLEAGSAYGADVNRVPGIFGQNFKTKYDWDFSSEPEPELMGRRCYLPAGRVLGGSSSINGMVYIRGHRVDYDSWASRGLEGWGYEEVLPYFKRSEDNERGESEYHGAGGPLAVSDSRESPHPLMQSYLAAGLELGLESNDDFNGEEQEGVGFLQKTQRNGLRCGAAEAFLEPARSRPNLETLTGAYVTELGFDGSRATSVKCDLGGAERTFRAEREIILCAGAYKTPQILMLSGFGPEAHLSEMGIAVRERLPVGENLQDHLAALPTWRTTEPALTADVTAENVALARDEGRGPMTSNVIEAGGFVRTDGKLPAPDVWLAAGPVMFHQEGLGAATGDAVMAGSILFAPTSVGRVTLRSPVPSAKPRIQHNFLQTEKDRVALVRGLRVTMEIAEQAAMKKIIDTPYSTPASCSDQDLLAFIRHNALSGYHPAGTCAMGSVVDAELKVLGTDGLRVVDASVMPDVVRGNTMAPTIMIAEKAADMIRERQPLVAAATAEERS